MGENCRQIFRGDIKAMINMELNTRNIYLVRHGQSKMNKVHIIQGQKQFPIGENGLTEDGRKQVTEVKIDLKKIPITRIFSSDLERCKETCAILNEDTNLPVHFAEELREQDCGKWEGKSSKDVHSEELKKRMLTEKEVVPEGGESLKDVEKRVVGYINKIIKEHKDEHILIVTHAAVIQTIVGYYLRIPYRFRFRIKPKASSVSHVILSKGFPPEIRAIGA